MFELAAVNWEAVLQPQNMVFICVFGMITIISVAGVIGGIWKSIKDHEQDVQLKRDLVARGYNADEIVRIIKTQPGKG